MKRSTAFWKLLLFSVIPLGVLAAALELALWLIPSNADHDRAITGLLIPDRAS